MSMVHTHFAPDYTIPVNEEDRVRKLYRFGILDTFQEGPFDEIAQLAADIVGTSGAWISFVDTDRVWYKSVVGPFTLREVAREQSICSLVVSYDDAVVVDLERGPVPSAQYALLEQHGIRFCAGVPIKTAEGYNIGALSVVDVVSKQPTEKQLELLRSLASILMDKLEQRSSIKNSHQVLDDLMERAIHDLKSPVTAIKALSQEIIRCVDEKESVLDISNLIEEASGSLLEGLGELKRLSRMEEGNFEICFETIVVKEELPKIVQDYERQAFRKAQKIVCDLQNTRDIFGDKIRVREIIGNLLSNAIKYSPHGGVICLLVKDKPGKICLEVIDEGQGLTEADQQKLFTKFAKLSAQPTGKESSIGLGLYIVKMLVDLHGGKIWAESEGKDKGTRFVVELPAKLTFRQG